MVSLGNIGVTRLCGTEASLVSGAFSATGVLQVLASMPSLTQMMKEVWKPDLKISGYLWLRQKMGIPYTGIPEKIALVMRKMLIYQVAYFRTDPMYEAFEIVAKL